MRFAMILIPIIAFLVFFLCAIAQFWLGRLFRQKLAERHPDVWAEISRKSWFIDSAVMGFAGSRKCRDLADPELSRVTKWIWLNQALALGSWLLMAALMFFVTRTQ